MGVFGCEGWARTNAVNSRALYQLSYVPRATGPYHGLDRCALIYVSRAGKRAILSSSLPPNEWMNGGKR
jgi:hypothetical protein